MRTSPRIEKTRVLRLAIPVCVVALLGGMLASGAGAARKGAKPPKAGKYAGKVGTFARIIFNFNRRKRAVVRFNAGVKTNCQRSSDGFITETKNLATAPAEQEPPAVLKVKRQGRRWAFEGTARDKEGVEWKVAGRFVSRVKARGTFEAAKFESLFNPSQPFGIDGQLCAGSGEWTAVRKRAKRKRR
jgi:hypothetical protein